MAPRLVARVTAPTKTHPRFAITTFLAAPLVWAALAVAQVPTAGPLPMALEKITMPPGFHIQLFAQGLTAARSMAIGDNGTLFVGTFGLITGEGNVGKVYAVRDNDGDYRADQVLTYASGLNTPNGIAFRDGDLYVGEMNRIVRYDDVESRLENPPQPVVLKDGLPTDGQHQWRYLEFGPDGKLYFGVGAPCNICERDDPYASIVRMNLDGTEFEIYARGVRNSVGLAFDPETGDLWFTDNGRDLLGDNLPSDELNHATGRGQHFGYPYCHQGDVVDPDFGRPGVCANYRPPEVKMGPHVAAIGLTFYTGDMFPAQYKNQIFVAEHGSWNRTTPLGYRLAVVRVQDGRSSGQEVFAQGWFDGSEVWGRPADVLPMPDGSLLVSDDLQGAIYRITYQAP
ncbi:MAG: sorbosone dehydrogenase family protein [Gemmatimonadetes bacterium]|nr:sorbosone dehydrogenase family protein [Gemmatimonadota bacterium]